MVSCSGLMLVSRLHSRINLYLLILKFFIFIYGPWASCYFPIIVVLLHICRHVYLCVVVLLGILSMSRPCFFSLSPHWSMSNMCMYMWIIKYLNIDRTLRKYWGESWTKSKHILCVKSSDKRVLPMLLERLIVSRWNFWGIMSRMFSWPKGRTCLLTQLLILLMLLLLLPPMAR